MFARSADRIAFRDTDDTVALGRPAGRRSPRPLGAALLGGAIEAGSAVGGRQAAAAGPRSLWRALVLVVWLGSRWLGAADGVPGLGVAREQGTDVRRLAVGLASFAAPPRVRRALLVAGLALAALVAPTAGATPALAAGPCGTNGVLSGSGAGVTCTYTTQGTEDTFTVPADVSSVSVTAVGAPGGTVRTNSGFGSGGVGAKVSNAALPVTPGATLWVDVGGPGANGDANGGCLVGGRPGGSFDGGTGGFCAGAGGGSSALLTAARATATLTGNVASDSRLLVAGGGGGGGQLSAGGGSAGNPAVTGAGAGGCSSNGDAGGVGPTDGTGGGPGGCLVPSCGDGAGTAGTAAMGGDGAPFCSGGGGGGGGWFGGGGGGSLGGGAAGGGGGGGSSYGGAGPSGAITITTASSSQAPEVTVTTNRPPSAAEDAFATDEDAPLEVAAPGVLGNDADPDGDALSAALVSGPANGSLQLNADGSFRYTPTADFNGLDSFSYRAGDGGLESDPVTVTIEVRPVDEPPPPADPASTPSAGTGATPPAGVAAPAGSAAPADPAIAQLRLASGCVRRSHSGRVRIRMRMRMARPRPVQVRIDRRVGTEAGLACSMPNPGRRFRKVTTLRRLPTQPAAAGRRRLTLKLRLAPGMYRLTVRAHLEGNRLSPPRRRYVRVLG